MRASFLLLLALLAAPAVTQEPSAEEQAAPAPGVDLERAAELAAQAHAALEAGDAKRAADLWEQAAALAPDAPQLRYNRAVALERGGDGERTHHGARRLGTRQTRR